METMVGMDPQIRNNVYCKILETTFSCIFAIMSWNRNTSEYNEAKPKRLDIPTARKKLEKFCAYQERSQKQVVEKCRDYGLNKEESEDLLIEMIQNNFINEQRFALAYARGKFKIKGWGKTKIRQGLMRQGVSEKLILLALDQISDESSQNTLYETAFKKLKILLKNEQQAESIINGESKLEYELKVKLMRYLLSKGFSLDEIHRLPI